MLERVLKTLMPQMYTNLERPGEFTFRTEAPARPDRDRADR